MMAGISLPGTNWANTRGLTTCLLVMVTLAFASTGLHAGPRLVVSLEDGSGVVGEPPKNKAGATVSLTPLLLSFSGENVTTTGNTDAAGRAVLEVSAIGAYLVSIRIDGPGGASYWSTRVVLGDAETEMVPGGRLSTDRFSPLEDFSGISCINGEQHLPTDAIRSILLGRFPVLHDELSLHKSRARALIRTGLKTAPPDLRDEVARAVDDAPSALRAFQTLTPLRTAHGLPAYSADGSGRLADENSDVRPAPAHASAIESVWLLYYLATQAEEDLTALTASLRECDGDAIATLPVQPDPAPEPAPLPQPDPVAQPDPIPHPDDVVTQPDIVAADTAPNPPVFRPAPPRVREPDLIPTANDDHRAASWSGLYIGGHAGAGFGDARYRAGVGALNIPINVNADGFLGGALLGYNMQYQQFVIGLEGDLSFGNVDGRTTLAGFSDPRLEIDFAATFRARLGYAWEELLVFSSIGLGFAEAHVTETLQTAATVRRQNTHLGLVVGGGLEWAVSETVSLRTEYIYGHFGRRNYTVGPATDDLEFDMHVIRAAIAIRLGNR